MIAFIPFDQVVAVDEAGDDCWGTGRGRPTIYVPIEEGGLIQLHDDYDQTLTRGAGRVSVPVDEGKRIKFFPDKFRRDELE